MKIRNYIFTILILGSILSDGFAQESNTTKYEAPFEYDENGNKVKVLENYNFDTEENDTNKIYIYVEKMPEFPGGNNALRRFIAESFIYPKKETRTEMCATIYLRFVVKRTGEIGKIEIQKGCNTEFDIEAIRVIRSLPKFKPGIQDGKPVNVWYSIPISIHLN